MRNVLDEHGFYRLPTQYEIHDHSVMESFVYSLSGEAYERLSRAISGRGAFRRFKDEVWELDLQEEWYAWRSDAYKQIAIEWCKDNGIAYE